MTRLVLDASVLLSGVVATPSSPPGRLLAAARTEAFELIACPLIFKEFRRGLAKPYFTKRVTATEADELLDAFELLDHEGLHPPALDARAACELLRLPT